MAETAQVRRVLGENGRILKPGTHVGFNTLPDQFVNREVQRGFYYNILVVGTTGIGKSTLMDSLFKHEFQDKDHQHEEACVSVDETVTELEESGVRLRLRIVSTAGFGDQLDRTSSAEAVLKYIDQQFEIYLQEELRIRRDLSAVADTRPHVCIYMLEPTGRHVKSLDIHVMKQLQTKVNLIPVIAKADVLNPQEVHDFKDLIKRELHDNDINIYRPEKEEDFDFEQLFPMAVIGSKSHITINGESLRVRQYPWGIVEVENEEHSDFVRLREMLLKTHMERLRRSTHDVHYNAFRVTRLTEMGLGGDVAQNSDGQTREISLRETYEKKRQETQMIMEKRENDMKAAFVKKAKAKEAELKAREQAMEASRTQFFSQKEKEKAMLLKQLEDLEHEKKLWEEGVKREREQQAQQEGPGKKREKTKKKHKPKDTN